MFPDRKYTAIDMGSAPVPSASDGVDEEEARVLARGSVGHYSDSKLHEHGRRASSASVASTGRISGRGRPVGRDDADGDREVTISDLVSAPDRGHHRSGVRDLTQTTTAPSASAMIDINSIPEAERVAPKPITIRRSKIAQFFGSLPPHLALGLSSSTASLTTAGGSSGGGRRHQSPQPTTYGGISITPAPLAGKGPTFRPIHSLSRGGIHYLHLLPDDVLFNISSFLEVHQIVSFSLVDIRCREMINTQNDIWRAAAMSDALHLTLDERRSAAMWLEPRERYVWLRQRKYMSSGGGDGTGGLQFERLRQADMDATARSALTRRLPFHYLSESVFTVTVPVVLFLALILYVRGWAMGWVVFPINLLQFTAFGLMFFLWGHESRGYESDYGLISTCLNYGFTDSPPISRKYTIMAALNACVMIFSWILAFRIDNSEEGSIPLPANVEREGWSWGICFFPIWISYGLLLLPALKNEQSTINWRVLWMVILGPLLLSTSLLALSLDHPSTRYIPLGEIMIPVWLMETVLGFVLVRLALRFGCHVIWRGWLCMTVADPYSVELGPDRDLTDIANAQNDVVDPNNEWRSNSVSVQDPIAAAQDPPKCQLFSASGAMAVAGITAYILLIVFEIMVCVRSAALHGTDFTSPRTSADILAAYRGVRPAFGSVMLPMMMMMGIIIVMSIRYAVLQYRHRYDTFLYQFDRPMTSGIQPQP